MSVATIGAWVGIVANTTEVEMMEEYLIMFAFKQ